jgi:hypothetical protein
MESGSPLDCVHPGADSSPYAPSCALLSLFSLYKHDDIYTEQRPFEDAEPPSRGQTGLWDLSHAVFSMDSSPRGSGRVGREFSTLHIWLTHSTFSWIASMVSSNTKRGGSFSVTHRSQETLGTTTCTTA